MDHSTSKTPLLGSENQSSFDPDDPRLRLAYPFYGGGDLNPYPPLIHAPQRLSSLATAFLFTVLVLVTLNGFLTVDSYQISFASGAGLLGLTPTDNIVDCKTWASAAYPLPLTPGTGYLPWKATELNVPIDEKDLFVFARGSSFSGVARVHESPDVKDLKVSVSARFRNEDVLSGTRVCLVERESGAHGVAILTSSRRLPPKEKLFFVVNVTLPSPGYGVSHLPGFTVDVPDFELEVDDLSAFDFDAINLKSTNNPITVKSIAARTVVVEGKNGKISGSFNTTQLLALSTTNDAIEASAHAHNAHPDQPTVISLKTANGPLHSNISLSSGASSTRGNFRISAHTTDAPLAIALSSDADARPVLLNLDAATNNAPAHVELPPAFEGRFLLRTTSFRPELREAPRVAGLVRSLRTSTVAGHAVFGNVSRVLPDSGGMREQGQGDADGGWAGVCTRNAPVTLVL